MDDVIKWCEERGMEIEHTEYGFKAEGSELSVFYRGSLLYIGIYQPENDLHAQIRADPADVEVNLPSLAIRRGQDTRIILGPKFVMDTSENGPITDDSSTNE